MASVETERDLSSIDLYPDACSIYHQAKLMFRASNSVRVSQEGNRDPDT